MEINVQIWIQWMDGMVSGQADAMMNDEYPNHIYMHQKSNKHKKTYENLWDECRRNYA